MRPYRQFHPSKTNPTLSLGAIVLFLVLMALPTAAQPPTVIGSRLEPLVDRQLIDKMDNARLKLHEPTPREIAIVYDQDWDSRWSSTILPPPPGMFELNC